jgi:LmbE family N-acetylglucosaminyl deacetylase
MTLDSSVPSRKLPSNIDKVMIIYPHPDDEILSAGGVMQMLAKTTAEVNWVVLTKGERGTADGSVINMLAQVRAKEASRIAKLLNVDNSYFLDFPDGDLVNQTTKLREKLTELVNQIEPELIITYDESGLYGHPDHVVASKIVRQISKENDIKLWHNTLPEKILKMIKLPTQMAKDGNFAAVQKSPNFKVYIGFIASVKKCIGVYMYKSQRESFRSSFPFRFIPMWMYIVPNVFEYYSKEKK